MPTSGKVRILKWFAILVVLVVLAAAALPFILDANQFRPQIESKLSSALGRDVKLGNLKLSIISGSVRVEDIRIADNPAFSKSPFVSAQSLHFSVELKPLIFDKAVRIQGITLDRPSITLIGSKSGQWNFSDLGSGNTGQKPSSPGASSDFTRAGVSIKQLEILDGQITLVHLDSSRKPSTINNVSVKINDLSYTSEFPFKLAAALPGEGSLRLEGKAGPFNKQDMTLTPLTAELDVKHFDLLASGFSEPGSGLAGTFDFSGSLHSNGAEVQSNGKASADKLRITSNGAPAGRMIGLQYSVDYNLLRRAGRLDDTKVEIGKAVARLGGTYELVENSLNLKMILRGTGMPVEDLTALFPAFGITLPKGAALKGGTLNANLSTEGPAEKLRTSGNVEIVKTRLTGFDLSGKMALVAAQAGLKSNLDTDIEQFTSTLQLSPEGIQVSSLDLLVPSIGKLQGSGLVAADQSLDFKMNATLTPAGGIGAEVARLIKRSSLEVPFFIRGTASNPKFVPDVKKAVGGMLESVLGGNTKDGQSKTGDSLQNAIRGLFKKK